MPACARLGSCPGAGAAGTFPAESMVSTRVVTPESRVLRPPGSSGESRAQRRELPAPPRGPQAAPQSQLVPRPQVRHLEALWPADSEQVSWKLSGCGGGEAWSAPSEA